jgi:hypothetical protein
VAGPHPQTRQRSRSRKRSKKQSSPIKEPSPHRQQLLKALAAMQMPQQVASKRPPALKPRGLLQGVPTKTIVVYVVVSILILTTAAMLSSMIQHLIEYLFAGSGTRALSFFVAVFVFVTCIAIVLRYDTDEMFIWGMMGHKTKTDVPSAADDEEEDEYEDTDAEQGPDDEEKDDGRRVQPVPLSSVAVTTPPVVKRDPERQKTAVFTDKTKRTFT